MQYPLKKPTSKCANQLIMSEGKKFCDPGGTAVNFDTGVEHFGKVCVGYTGK